jgi:hypothetical protein
MMQDGTEQTSHAMDVVLIARFAMGSPAAGGWRSLAWLQGRNLSENP